MHTCAERLAHGQQTNRQDNVPAIGTRIADVERGRPRTSSARDVQNAFVFDTLRPLRLPAGVRS
jgi:hypothetical protein